MSRVLRSILFKKKYGVIRGFFGGGKTFSITKHIKWDINRDKYKLLYIYASPLRKLRDFIADVWFQGYGDHQLFIFRAHDEVCPMLARRLEEAGKGSKAHYYKIVYEHINSDECMYRSHFRNLVDFIELNDNSRIIITTHDLGILASLIAFGKKIPYVAVFDEAEDYLEKISNPIPAGEIEALKQVDEELYKRVKKFFEKSNGYYWIRASNFNFFLNNVIVTATLPRSLYYFLEYKYVDMFNTYIPQYTIKTPPSSDVVFVYNKVIPSHAVSSAELLSEINRLVEYGVDNYGAVGIVAKNKYPHEQLLYDFFKQMGYRVSAEIVDEKPDPEAQVYILTPGGKWYRGVSIYNKRTGKDIPFIIAFYQGGKQQYLHPRLHDLLASLYERFEHSDVDVLVKYSTEMNYAKNLQSLYRYNRVRKNRHIMILLDARWVRAFRYYHQRKWKSMERYSFLDLPSLRRRVVGS